jgi:hypothetical protein
MEERLPAGEVVDHLRFQISLLRLCSVPDLATSVRPEQDEAPVDSASIQRRAADLAKAAR